jgi:hypothetical protein
MQRLHWMVNHSIFNEGTNIEKQQNIPLTIQYKQDGLHPQQSLLINCLYISSILVNIHKRSSPIHYKLCIAQILFYWDCCQYAITLPNYT